MLSNVIKYNFITPSEFLLPHTSSPAREDLLGFYSPTVSDLSLHSPLLLTNTTPFTHNSKCPKTPKNITIYIYLNTHTYNMCLRAIVEGV